ncbi:MAG: hypothetical protein AMS26_15640 [Bacteroides sp. SM23_62]|nr:MAG: hypothetical protein AMS26_15640 [Bacteroides sp. SM23_62]
MEVTEDRFIKIRMNTTSYHEQAKVVLKAKGEVLFQDTIRISPEKPFGTDVSLPASILEDDLAVLLLCEKGKTLLSYKPAEHHPPDYPMPEALKPPAPPEEIKTIEELYLSGLRLNQFYNASLEPRPYYEEALKRDPGNYRVNTQLGISYIKRKMWHEAEEKLRIAVERITSNYTRPKDGEALYYLGVVLKTQGKLDEAYDYLYKASWSVAWYTPAYYQLAEIDCQRSDFESALKHLDRAISTNTNNFKALSLKVVVLRKMNDFEAAIKQAEHVLSKDVLNHQAKNELVVLMSMLGENKRASELLDKLKVIMRDKVQSYLELATDYSNCGFYEEAIDVLSRLEQQGNTYPMLYYYLGFYWSKLAENAQALEYYKSASQMPYTYCFPFRAESIDVLHHAMKFNPEDARAPYYLGNLLYENQPEHAIAEWEKSCEIDTSFYIVHRNLAVAYEQVQNDVPKALASMEKAVICNRDDPRLLFEMDLLYEKNKVPSQRKYELLKNNMETAIRRTESLLRLATRAVEYGKYDEAIEILLNNSFPQFEGGREMQDTYLNAFSLRGLEYFNNGKFAEALKDFKTALSFPVGRWGRSRRAQFHYLLGTVYEAQNDWDKAQISYQNTLDIDVPWGGRDQEFMFYHGLALNKMGKSKEAKKVFEDMLERTQSVSGSAFFRQFEAGQSRDMQIAANHYLTGLAYEGLGKFKKAKEAFANALKLNPSHVWSKVHLESL